MSRAEPYDGTPVCPRCGNGWPVCAEVLKRDAPQWVRAIVHRETCGRYLWRDLCERCDGELENELDAAAAHA